MEIKVKMKYNIKNIFSMSHEISTASPGQDKNFGKEMNLLAALTWLTV